MTDDHSPDDLPEDPFDQEVPEFPDFTGPHADEIRELLNTYVGAKPDFKALVHQASFRELGTAIQALDDDRARAALLTAMTHHVFLMKDRARFAQWLEAQGSGQA